ncbi:F0F1 ATP synthase subunit gamma [Bacteroides ihuae]|uniref:F0F1 ATP synthase subunit gamma n=1 Tax=Bacteroides ihuae TaxID=1852362 RepID=UPI0008DB074C|nr:F0F1 ATP synthase subunit gamma [Bacteroides ihuae]
MASLKEIKSRITSVKSTRQITSAMKMVASAKLHKAQGAIENMLPYQSKLNAILTNFLSNDSTIESPYIVSRPVHRVAIVIFSSNSSLCGAFNANIIKQFEQVMEKYSSLGQDNILIYPIGKKIETSVKKKGYATQGSFQHLADKPSYQEASELAVQLMGLFVSQEVDKVELIYHHFKSVGSHTLVHEDYLPIDLTTQKVDVEKSNIDYIVEPSASEFITSLLPRVITLKIFTALLDSNASEHAARTMAMQVATDNANELILDLTKQYNKSRQQAITNELLDIIGGSMK